MGTFVNPICHTSNACASAATITSLYVALVFLPFKATGARASMPGILPMKVIKVGTTSGSRIAQACDRCRSKKIRCDGVTPCCSQCSSVGFECRTSDKLSRRAFPRGYTESLEERVRSLEAEVKEMKDLLDEKDEKIDILCRVRSNTSSVQRPSETRSPFSNTGELSTESSSPKEDTCQTESPPIPDSQSVNPPTPGPSNGKAFVGSSDIFPHPNGD